MIWETANQEENRHSDLVPNVSARLTVNEAFSNAPLPQPDEFGAHMTDGATSLDIGAKVNIVET